jgi:N-acetylmuramoyl-L-alanine amidase
MLPKPPFRLLAGAVLLVAALLGGVRLAEAARVSDVRLWSGPEGTRLVLDLTSPVRYQVFTIENPDRVVIDLASTELAMEKDLPAGQGVVRKVRSGPQADGGLRIVLDLVTLRPVKSFAVAPDGTAGHRLVIEMPPTGARVAASPAPAPAQPPPDPDSTKVAASRTVTPTTPQRPGTKVAAVSSAAAPPETPDVVPVKAVSTAAGRDVVIAVDAGHGGQDPGAIGRGGTREKDVTLAIARRLAKAIDAEEGMRAVLIRDGDHFITLGGRTRKARQLGADMFVSIHADSVLNRTVSGSSVYVLSLRGASDEAARWLAERENAADLMGGVSLDDKNDVLASVLLDVTQKEAVSNSVDAADSVLSSLRRVGSVHSSRVRHAGFVVLKSPDIPSMLVETAFISNASDERRLRDPVHQQRVAEAIRTGVRDFFYDKPPPGTKLAALASSRRGGASSAQTLAER